MNSAAIAKEIKALHMIASTQVQLVEHANASSAHTAAVLNEIAERLGKITPSGIVYPVDLSDDEGLERDLEGVIGFCEATSDEQHGVWGRLVNHRAPALTWKQHGGWGREIGRLDDRPIFVSLSFVSVGGHKVCFYEATSTVVDHTMVREYIETIAPASAKSEGGRLNHTNSGNFCNILPRGWQTTEGLEA